MKQQIPNLLSISRIVLSPLVIFLYFYNSIISAVLALIFLIILEITDALDGAMARKFNLVSDLGKVLDPFADTVFHITMFTIFLYEGSMPIWMYIISLYRDMFSMFIRILGGLRGFAVAAKFSGKLKTASRAAAVVIIFLLKILKHTEISLPYEQITYYSLLVVTIITIYSFFDYMPLITGKSNKK